MGSIRHQAEKLQGFSRTHCVRVAKEMDEKSIGLCPQGFDFVLYEHVSTGMESGQGQNNGGD